MKNNKTYTCLMNNEVSFFSTITWQKQYHYMVFIDNWKQNKSIVIPIWINDQRKAYPWIPYIKEYIVSYLLACFLYWKYTPLIELQIKGFVNLNICILIHVLVISLIGVEYVVIVMDCIKLIYLMNLEF